MARNVGFFQGKRHVRTHSNQYRMIRGVRHDALFYSSRRRNGEYKSLFFFIINSDLNTNYSLINYCYCRKRNLIMFSVVFSLSHVRHIYRLTVSHESKARKWKGKEKLFNILDVFVSYVGKAISCFFD